MNYGQHEARDGLVSYHQSAFDTSMIIAQLLEYNNVLKNKIVEISINDGRDLSHSSLRAIEKEHVPNGKSEKNECSVKCDAEECKNEEYKIDRWHNTCAH